MRESFPGSPKSPNQGRGRASFHFQKSNSSLSSFSQADGVCSECGLRIGAAPKIRPELEKWQGSRQELQKRIACLEQELAARDSEMAEVHKLRYGVEKAKHVIAQQDSELHELQQALESTRKKHVEDQEAAKDRHKILLLSVAERWFGGAPWELVRALWSGWQRLQQIRRTNLEIAKVRRTIKMEQKPLHMQVLQRWVAQNDAHAVRLCFSEWHGFAREIRAIAAENLQEKERIDESARRQSMQQEQMEKRLQRVRTSVLHWANNDATLTLKSVWSAWLEFCKKEKQDKEDQAKAEKQVNETRRIRIEALLLLSSGGDESHLKVVLSQWREYARVSRQEREAFLDRKRLQEIHDRQLDQMMRKQAMLFQEDGGRMQILMLWASWREYVHVIRQERAIDAERKHQQELHVHQVQRQVFQLLGTASKSMTLEVAWSAWREFCQEACLERAKEREKREVAEAANKALDAQKKLRVDLLFKTAFLGEQDFHVILQTICAAWCEITQESIWQRTHDSTIRQKEQEQKLASDVTKKQRELAADDGRLAYFRYCVGVWDENSMTKLCFESWLETVATEKVVRAQTHTSLVTGSDHRRSRCRPRHCRPQRSHRQRCISMLFIVSLFTSLALCLSAAMIVLDVDTAPLVALEELILVLLAALSIVLLTTLCWLCVRICEKDKGTLVTPSDIP
eukprot:gnl/MRDRNA2_/MRDRNA2_126508_c0_seq1.p1 gnl/MRDRNA2_/MRDRNA2_126508_c0~~gnl/MRDRNA2_/MRDRNA2_126508_c0_seq1.p1  ORF type:complete len:683 (-),score=137.21 gnl/MRDRNA2_/MRDRNA2_126508_c0_seq1:184-2232(-)